MENLTTTDDASLLAEWADQQSETAFTVLMRKYQGLVFGAALRRSSQPEVARDVCQQVFSLVAARARLLVGHANIAGWLYHAATRIASQTLRGEARRRERQEGYQATTTFSEAKPDERWQILEESLGALGGRDREALVLHYFQDLSYPEMARALGIEESTARQRVSRAVERLGKKLRGHGYAGAVPALLAGAASWSATAGAALPTVAAVMAAGAAPTLGLTLSAIMSHTACKVAAVVVVAAALPWMWQWTEPLRAAPPEPTPPPLVASVGAPSASPTDAETQALEKLQAARRQANWRAADLGRLAQNADTEILESLGTIEELARKAGRTARILLKSEDVPTPAPNTPEWDRRSAEMMAQAEKMPELLGIARQLPRIERDAARAATFYATFISEMLELDDGLRGRLQDDLQTWVTNLQRDSLALPQRPTENPAPWDVRRVQAMETQITHLFTLLPPAVAASHPELKSLLSQSPQDLVEGSDTSAMMDFLFGAKR